MNPIAQVLSAAAGLVCVVAGAAQAQPIEQFYRGKTVPLIIAFDVGGGYDVYARLAGRHLANHIPGKPTIVPQNMPGAGGLAAMNYLYKIAPKDGAVLGATHSNIALGQLLDGRNIEYDAKQFNWVGRMTSAVDVHYTWHTSPTKRFADIKTRETIAAGTGPTSNSVIYPRILNELLGTRLKLITGFKGTTDGNLALERGEVEMVLKPWEGVKSGNADWLRDKKINLIVQYAANRHPDLPELPTVVDVMETEEQRQIIRLFAGTSDIGRSLVMPPGTPPDRVEAMRTAFMAAMKDPQFLAEAEKAQLEVDPMSGADLQKMMAATFDMPPAVVERAEKLYKQQREK